MQTQSLLYIGKKLGGINDISLGDKIRSPDEKNHRKVVKANKTQIKLY